MGMLAWVVMGLAVWHFTIWLPDHFWGGIVGALIGSIVGAIVIGLAIHGFSIPGTRDTHLITAIEGIPGSLIGMAVVYAVGLRRGPAQGDVPPAPPAPPVRRRRPAAG
jgi:Na+/proline symporter